MYFWTLIPHCPRNHTKRVNVYGITQTICRSVAHTFTHRTVLCTRVYFVNHISRDKCALYVCVIVVWCDARLSANSYMFSYNNKENIVAKKEDLYFPRQKPNSKRFSWALISVRFRWTTWTLVLLFDHFIDIIFFLLRIVFIVDSFQDPGPCSVIIIDIYDRFIYYFIEFMVFPSVQ